MNIRDLVCNYFERTGNFKNIEATCIGTALSEIARCNHVSVEDTCYQILGYSGKKEFETKVAVIKGDESVLNALKADNLKDAADELKIGKLRKVKPPVSKVKVNGIYGLDLLVAEFYKNDLTNVVPAKNGYELLPFWLFKHVNVSLETVLNDEAVKPCFVKFAVASCGQPVVMNKTLYTDFKISKKDQEAINREAFRLALHKGEGTGWFYKMPADDLIFISENDPDTYLNLLKYATASQLTYADLLRTKFIEIPDFLELYGNLQCIFYKFGSKIAYKKGDTWIFEKVFHFLSDTVQNLKEPLEIGGFLKDVGNSKTRGNVNAIHCF